MKRREYIKGPLKVARLARLTAKLIDFGLALVLSALFYPLGVILGITYLSICDFLKNGQSVGKSIIGISVISITKGKPCSLKRSIIRNIPFTFPLIFSVIPFWGWSITLILLIPFTCFELYLLFKLESAHRMGDVLADTTVVNSTPKAEVKAATDVITPLNSESTQALH